MEIRQVNRSDSLEDISTVYEQSWKYAYRGIIPQDYLDGIPPGRWISGINKNVRTDVIALDWEKIIGAAAFCPSRWEKYSGWGEIASLYLLPGYTGRGIGRSLSDTACLSWSSSDMTAYSYGYWRKIKGQDVSMKGRALCAQMSLLQITSAAGSSVR